MNVKGMAEVAIWPFIQNNGYGSIAGGSWTCSTIILLVQVCRVHFLGILPISSPLGEENKFLFFTRRLDFDLFIISYGPRKPHKKEGIKP